MTPAAQEVIHLPAGMRTSMAVRQIDPLRDPRWSRLVESHPASSIFHTQGWLEALRRTYNYEPVVLTTSAEGEPLENGLALCKVSSWLTGNRLVSLPFSDHCQPLVDDPAALHIFLNYLEEQVRTRKYKYAELRPLAAFDAATETAARAAVDASFCIHMLDLRPPAEALLQCFHKSHIQRKIARAKKEELRIETGRSAILLGDFYRLMLITRRRHGIPPQPVAWFRNVLECVGEPAAIRVAYKGEIPVAAIFTATHKKTMVYKYGCSDGAYSSMGGTPFLFWDAVQEAKKQGLEEFDFGRSEIENEGLVNFKDHWGTTRTNLRYYRYPYAAPAATPQGKGWKMKMAERVCEKLPDAFLTLAGKLLYRHVG